MHMIDSYKPIDSFGKQCYIVCHQYSTDAQVFADKKKERFV